MDDTCAICTGTQFQSDGYDHDLRTLVLRNGYDLSEGCDRLVKSTRLSEQHAYEITTCKECRGEFMEMLWLWANGGSMSGRADANPDATIPYRRAGRTVMITPEEWETFRGGSAT